MICPRCNSQVPEGQLFCGNCGQDMRSVQNTALNAPPPSVQNSVTDSQAKEVKPLAVFGITMGVGLALMAAFVLLIKPGYLLHKDDAEISADESSIVTVTTVSQASPVTASETTKTDGKKKSWFKKDKTDTDEASKPEPKTESVTTTEKPTETKPEKTSTTTETAKPAETTAPATDPTKKESGLSKADDAYNEALSYSTYQRPDFSEFEWCFGQNGLIYIPTDYDEMITEPLGYSGGWKAMIIYNPTNSAGTFIRELDNFDIIISDKSAYVTIDWYLMETDGSELSYEEDMSDTVFSGYIYSDGISAVYAPNGSEQSSMILSSFWKKDGKEYALGEIATSDGLWAYVALVRK